jgi:hypothetical protein
MGFFTPEQNTPDFRAVTGQVPVIPDPPSADALGAAAFQQDNEVVSAIAAIRNSGPFAPDPSHNPIEATGFRGSHYERDHLDRFLGSRSEPETRAIMGRIDQELANDKTLEAGGMGGVVLRMMAGSLSPTLALPAGVIVGSSKAGLTFMRAAARTGAAGAVQTGLQEAALQASQETRSPTGSALSVGTATILSALLGGAAVKLMSPAEHGAAVASLDRARADMDAHAGNIGTPAPAGAATADTRALELVPYGINQIPGVGPATQQIDPMSRMLTSPSLSARRAAVDLAETPLRFKENLEGVATSAGPSLERLAKMAIDQTRVNVTGELDRLFAEYRFGNAEISIPRLRSQFEDFRGKSDGYMTFDAFKQEIAKAMTEGDKSANPFVEQAAQHIRNTVFEPWKKRAIAAGQLPESIDVKTADSYFMRVYNKQAIAARRPEFVDRVTSFLKGDQAAKAAAKERLGAFQGALDVASGQIDKINRRIAVLSEDVDVVQARAQEATRLNKFAFERSTALRESQYVNDGGIRVDAPGKNIEKARGGATFETKVRNRGNELADRASGKLAEIESLQQKLAAEIANHDAMRGKIEAEIEAWQGHSSTEARSALRARAKASEGRAPDAARLAGADPAIDSAVRRILESDRNLSEQELRSLAHEVTQRILGSPDGRLPYEAGSSGHGVAGDARGPLARRVFNIPDATIREFLEQDVEHIVHSHLRTMVPDVLLAERFGDVRMTEAFRKIEDDFAKLIDGATSEKAGTALNKQRETAIRDLGAVRDRIRGTYGSDYHAIMPNAVRVAAGLKNYNLFTNLGMAAISSLPDMSGTVFRHGLTNVFNDAWAPFLKSMMGQSEAFGQARAQLKAMGIANEALLASRQNAISDIMDTYRPQSRVERTLQWGANKFMLANMLAQWTDIAKTMAALPAMAEILRAASAVAKGTATRRQIANLAESSIDAAMARRIHEQFKTAGEIVDGVHLANTSDWIDRGAREAFEGAVGREADIAVITPGQEKSLWLSNPILGVLGQFKSFTAAATQRILIANLQRRDAQVLQGLLTSLAMGMISYKVNSLLGGQKTSDRPQDWIKEGISKGGLLGWFEEGNALASKMTRGGVDMYRLIGSDKPLSRYAGRSVLDQMLGPTAGKIAGVAQVTGAAGRMEWNEGDTHAVRRLIIGQNLFWLRGVLNETEGGVNAAFGIPMKAPR